MRAPKEVAILNAKMISSFSVLSPTPVKTTITSFSTYLKIVANVFHDETN